MNAFIFGGSSDEIHRHSLGDFVFIEFNNLLNDLSFLWNVVAKCFSCSRLSSQSQTSNVIKTESDRSFTYWYPTNNNITSRSVASTAAGINQKQQPGKSLFVMRLFQFSFLICTKLKWRFYLFIYFLCVKIRCQQSDMSSGLWWIICAIHGNSCSGGALKVKYSNKMFGFFSINEDLWKYN